MVARRTTRAQDIPEDASPDWQRTSVERSLTGARARAQERSDRFVAAALEIIAERDTVDFAVQDVVDRSKMSIRTFYNFFASKEDLLVALQQTIMSTQVVPPLRKRCVAEKDPVKRLQVYVRAVFELSASGGPASRTLTTNHNRLSETRPADLERAMHPQLELVTDLVADAAETGRLTTELDVKTASRLFHQTVLATVHANILGAGITTPVGPEQLWAFCAAALGVRPSGG